MHGRLGNPEVSYLHLALVGDEDVLGAYVAVDDVEGFVVLIGLSVGVIQSLTDLGGDVYRDVRGEGFLAFPAPVHDVPEVYAMYELHRDIVVIPDLAQVVGLNDVGVGQ